MKGSRPSTDDPWSLATRPGERLPRSRRTLGVVLVVAVALCALLGVSASGVAAASVRCPSARRALTYLPGGAPASSRGLRPLVQCRYDTGFGAMEPSFAFGPDGRI